MIVLFALVRFLFVYAGDVDGTGDAPEREHLRRRPGTSRRSRVSN